MTDTSKIIHPGIHLPQVLSGSIRHLLGLTHLVFMSFTAPVLALPQKFILLCFLTCFYFGISLYTLNQASFDLADVGFVLIVIGYFSFLLVPSGRRLEPSAPAAKPILMALWVFVGWCFVSAMINLPRHSATAVWNSIWFLFNFIQLPIAFYIFSSNTLQKYREFILNTILFFSCGETILGFLQYFLFSQAFVTGTFTIHHAMLANMMVPGVVIALSRFLKNKKPKSRLVYAGLTTLFLYTIIISATRSILGGIGIALLVFLLHFIKLRWKHLLTLGVIIIALFTVIKMTPLEKIINNTIRSRDTPLALDISTFGRVLIWKGSVEHFLNIPLHAKLIGCGPGTFSTILFDFFVYNKKGSSGAHNNYLHALIETGIIGLALFAILFTKILVSLFRRSKKDPLAFSLFYGTIALLGSGLSQETFWVQPVFGNFWLFYILMLGLIIGNTPKKTALCEPRQDSSN